MEDVPRVQIHQRSEDLVYESLQSIVVKLFVVKRATGKLHDDDTARMVSELERFELETTDTVRMVDGLLDDTFTQNVL